MAARWVGLAPSAHRNRKPCRKRTVRDGVRALSLAGVLTLAAALNFALYPSALASVFNGDMVSLVPADPTMAPALALAPVDVDEADLHLLAATAWAEARSEGEFGMRAVAHVIVNRVGQRFGDNIETVILSPKQFSAWNIGDPNRALAQNPEAYATGGANLETWETAQTIAREVLSGQSVDPTAGALFYHTKAIRPWWSRYGQGRREIGAHVFYRDVPDQPRRARARGVTHAAAEPAHGPRAGRVNGVIQYAPMGYTVSAQAIETSSAPAPAPAPSPSIAEFTALVATATEQP